MKTKMIVTVIAVLISAITSRSVEISDRLINAMIQTESSGNDWAVGDRVKSFGPLQVSKPVCDDINNRFGTRYQAEDCRGNRALSVKLLRLYIDMYATESRLGRIPTERDIARIWNGGPSGCFDNGRLDKDGRMPKLEENRLKLMRLQTNTASYWLRVSRYLK